MTPDELSIEWQVTYQTRLGCLCADAQPTTEQIDIAFMEASEHVEKLKQAVVS